jgi:serine protease
LALPTAAVAQPQARAGELIVGYDAGTGAARQDAIAKAAGTAPGIQVSPSSQVVDLRPGESAAAAARRLKASGDVRYVARNLIAHATAWKPNDRYKGRLWTGFQWNLLSREGINALGAWQSQPVSRRGGRGVRIAVVDTGIAYRDYGKYRRSPDFNQTRFADPYDFVAGNTLALDRAGHGTHVTSTIAVSTNNGIGLTGIAYAATIIPVRVLDAKGEGDSVGISLGIRWAADHGAQVINMSLEFDPSTDAADIPDIIDAINYATSKGALVVGAAGNDRASHVSFPAQATNVVAVGATTQNRCLADYSNYDRGLDIVAPGGGVDRALAGEKNCHPMNVPGGDIVQLGLAPSGGSGVSASQFSLDSEDGTSMAAPHVSATAALVIASGVIGKHPSPAALRARLYKTSTPLGTSLATSQRRAYYGAGLVNAARAVSRSVR